MPEEQKPVDTPKTKVDLVKDFVKAHPKKIAAVILALLSTMSPDTQAVIKAILEALLASN